MPRRRRARMLARAGLGVVAIGAACLAASRPAPAHGADPAQPAEPSAGGPDCRGFGGKIHGTTTCVRLDLATGTVRPLTVRPMPGPGVVSADCPGELPLAHATLRLVCDRQPAPADAGALAVVTVVSADIVRAGAADGGPPPRRVRLDRSTGYHDFIHVWALEHDGVVDLAIDHGVLD